VRNERVAVYLPLELAKKVRRAAAERHVTVSAYIAWVLERQVTLEEMAPALERVEIIARAALYGAAELLDPAEPARAAAKLVNRAAASVERMKQKEAGERDDG